MKNYYTQKTQGGFTLIEIMISLAIFTVVALISVGSLLRIVDANRKSLNLKTAVNNINFALESMSREVRVGSKYRLDSHANDTITKNYSVTQGSQKISNTDWVLIFTSSEKLDDCNLIYAYRYYGVGSTKTLQKAQQDRCNDSIRDADFKNLISDDVRLAKSIISVDNSKQPKVSIILEGSTGVRERDRVDFILQTTMSQRIK